MQFYDTSIYIVLCAQHPNQVFCHCISDPLYPLLPPAPFPLVTAILLLVFMCFHLFVFLVCSLLLSVLYPNSMEFTLCWAQACNFWMFSFIRNCQTVSQSGCVILHPLQHERSSFSVSSPAFDIITMFYCSWCLQYSSRCSSILGVVSGSQSTILKT